MRERERRVTVYGALDFAVTLTELKNVRRRGDAYYHARHYVTTPARIGMNRRHALSPSISYSRSERGEGGMCPLSLSCFSLSLIFFFAARI